MYKETSKEQKINKLGVKSCGDNFHTNFVDLNPKWAATRHDRAMKMAQKIRDRIGAVVKLQVEKQTVKEYEKEFKKGRRLEYGELKVLKTDIKDVYTKVIDIEHKDQLK